MRLLYVFVLVTMAKIVLSANEMFNCNRDSQSCEASSTCETAGSCTCTGTRSNYNCNHDTATAGSCTGCGAGALCGAGDICQCPEGLYSGTAGKCGHKRLLQKCSTSGSIIINANLEGAFKVHPQGKEGTCAFDKAATTAPTSPVPIEWKGYYKKIDVGDANCDVSTTVTVGGVNVRCINIEVIFQDKIRTNLDLLVTFCCADTVVSDVTVGFLAPTDLLPLGTTVPTPTGSSADLTVKMTDASSTTLTDGATVAIGDPVWLDIELNAAADFSTLLVTKCTAQEAQTTPTVTVEFITASCITKSFATSSIRVGKKVTIKTTAVKITDQSNVYYVCDVKLCTTETDCAAGSSCTKGGFGRKKREISVPSNKTVTEQRIFTYVTVRERGQASEVRKTAENAAVEAVSRVNMTAAVVGLAAVVLILLCACLILGVCLLNRRRHGDVKGSS